MSEKTIQEGIQTALQAMTEFATADVVINDWGVLDQSTLNAPYVIIENSDDFGSRQDVVTAQNTWSIPITLVERWTDWKTTLDNFRTRRQAILDKIKGAYRSPGSSAVNILEIRADGPVGQIYDLYTDPEETPNAQPIYVSQRMVLEAEEF